MDIRRARPARCPTIGGSIMQFNHRKAIARVSALLLVLMLLTSLTASYAAASFTKSGAGVRYNGTFKLGATTSEAALKKAFGSNYKRSVDSGCTFGYATYRYNFSSKGIMIETLQKTKGAKEQIITIQISKSTVPTIAGLRVGNSVSTLGKKYGTKCQISGTTAQYKSGSYYMRVYTKSKKTVSKIVFWIDL